MELSNWLIVENRLDIFDQEQTTQCFVGFRNTGYVVTNPVTNNYFVDQSIKFLKFVMALEDFQNPLVTDRIGVRSRFLRPFEGSMEELVDRYKARFYGLTQKAEAALNGNLIDIGGSLNFSDISNKHANFNTFHGPMPIEQAKQFFPKGKDHPSVGLYFDIDYWCKPASAVKIEEFTKTIRQFANESLKKEGLLAQLIIGELRHGEEAWATARSAAQASARPNA
jgi:hypothetical protein